MQDSSYRSPTRIVFGKGTIAKAVSRSACHRTPKWPARGGSTGFVTGPGLVPSRTSPCLCLPPPARRLSPAVLEIEGIGARLR
jgi:hypothetical protein